MSRHLPPRAAPPSPPVPPAGQPNYKPSGILNEESHYVNGTRVKFVPPHEAVLPDLRWRLHVFKSGEQIDVYHLHRKSHFRFGRDRDVVDIPTDHASCSKEHAAIFFRSVNRVKEGQRDPVPTIKPYIVDLGSSNGTFLNQEKIPSDRPVELRASDVIRFGYSSREYVLLFEEMT